MGAALAAPERQTAGCPASSGHWLLTPALRNLSRRVLAGRVLHRTGSVAGGWGGRGGREPAWGGGRWGVGGRQPALTSQWWRQVSTINIAHRIGRGLGQRLGQQQGAGGAALYSRQPRLMGPWCTGLATSPRGQLLLGWLARCGCCFPSSPRPPFLFWCRHSRSPLPGLATQASSSLKVNVISPCARTSPDGGAAPRHSLGTAHGCHGCLLASSSKASVAWVSGAHSTPGTHSEVPFPRHPLAASPPLALPFGQRHSCEVVGMVVGVSDVDF